MDKIEHRNIPINGLNMHVAEIGKGPLVLFLHGFPELWYSWRHQMLFLAERGFRAVAPDMRGYGDTTGAPLHEPSKFTIFHVVGDLILLLDAIGNEDDKVFVVGHDWGAMIAWMLCLYRPDRVKALVNLSVAFPRIHPQTSFVEASRRLFGDDYYISRFQEPGEIEADFARIGAKEILKYVFAFRTPGPLFFPKNADPSYYAADRPPWLTEEDLGYYASKFQQSGFTGGVNYYRALDLSWELHGAFVGAKIVVPTKFIVGDLDLTYHMPGVQDFIHKGEFQKHVPSLKEVVVIEGAAHFINQERADDINQHIHDFLTQF
ncbi:uncharacterized protein LOC127251203 [Andrographis paniculata]|uniref:uncharacterized protein LOC127251203 n=1 Tax=Andrographis paniculata TaxID=175694 RepID=UPI0021E9A118|nr:uncharacterized protein LOC127251203 [Andrographis paniculata]